MIPFIIFALFFPALVQLLRDNFKPLSFLNPLITSYAMGILLGNTVMRGQAAFGAFDIVSTVSVALSIPLMLFTMDVRSWGRTTGTMMLGMALACASVLVAVTIGVPLFSSALPAYPELSGLLVGVYTGGTPNLAALRIALNVDKDLYLAVHAADMAVGALYILFYITVAKHVFGWFLEIPAPPAVGTAPETGPGGDPHNPAPGRRFPFIGGVLRSSPRLPLARNVGLTIGSIAAAFALSLAVAPGFQTMVVILGITTIAIALSFARPVRETRGSFELGEYFILVFSFAAGAMGDVRRILGASPMVFLLVAYTVLASMLIHVVLCRLFRVDRNAMMISSTAAICSPPFVGLVAGALGDRRLIAPGITAGIVGYAVGNYLGVLAAKVLALL